MAKLLYIEASPRGDRSTSSLVCRRFLDAYRRHHGGDEVVTVNVFDRDLPAVGGPALEAKYTILHGQQPTAEQAQAWKAVEEVIEQFKSADKYVLAVPMWNFGIPYRLKHYIDVVVQPTYTFAFSPQAGYSGLVTARPAVVVYARGGDYSQPETAALDLQRPYVEQILGFMGFTDIHAVTVEPTLMAGPDLARQKTNEAVAHLEELARTF